MAIEADVRLNESCIRNVRYGSMLLKKLAPTGIGERFESADALWRIIVARRALRANQAYVAIGPK
jgi:hypothetical protein